jgi:hypothetical protein
VGCGEVNDFLAACFIIPFGRKNSKLLFHLPAIHSFFPDCAFLWLSQM